MILVDSLEAVVGYTNLLVCTNTAPVPGLYQNRFGDGW